MRIEHEHNGKTYTGEMGEIEVTRIGREDHGIFTGSIDIKFGTSTYQSFGNYFFDAHDGESEQRIFPDGFGMAWMAEVMGVVGVDTWEKVAHRPVIAFRGSDDRIAGLGGVVRGETRTFFMEDLIALYRPQAS